MDKAINEFRMLAEERWYHIENGDSRRGNKCFDKLTKIVTVLKDEGKLEELAVLLGDENEGVRFETASKLLHLYPAEAVRELELIAKKKGSLPFVAKQTLQQWKEGNMKGQD